MLWDPEVPSWYILFKNQLVNVYKTNNLDRQIEWRVREKICISDFGMNCPFNYTILLIISLLEFSASNLGRRDISWGLNQVSNLKSQSLKSMQHVYCDPFLNSEINNTFSRRQIFPVFLQ